MITLAQIVNRPHPSFVLTISVALSKANSSQREFMFPFDKAYFHLRFLHFFCVLTLDHMITLSLRISSTSSIMHDSPSVGINVAASSTSCQLIKCNPQHNGCNGCPHVQEIN